MLPSIFPLPRLLSCRERIWILRVHAYISARLLPQSPHTGLFAAETGRPDPRSSTSAPAPKPPPPTSPLSLPMAVLCLQQRNS